MSTPHNYGSFSYKVTDQAIRKVLNSRAALHNVVQASTPFVKATTTIESPEFLGDGNIGFTLGIHNVPWSDPKYTDFFGNASGDLPYVGYTYTTNNTNVPVHAKEPGSDVSKMLTLFDQGQKVYTDSVGRNFSRIAPPGITQFSVGRNKAGVLSLGEFTFSVPSIMQLEVLHRLFLVPGIGIVLEWGQQFADIPVPTAPTGPALTQNNIDFYKYGQTGLLGNNVDNFLFPWYDVDRRRELLARLGRREVGVQEIINNYVIPTQGQYMWMFGRVANFTTKANADGSFECSVKVYGPSEDAWAYDVKKTVIPPKDNSGNVCADSVHSISSYFKVSSPGLNLASLLSDVVDPNGNHPWKNHVIKIDNGNQKIGEQTEGGVLGFLSNLTGKSKPANISEYGFGDDRNAYFMTWRFFVNVVLNDENVGVKAIFKRAGLLPEELSRIAILRPYVGENITGNLPIDDPYENFVGSSKYLRSIDPSVMIIVNETAAELADIKRKNSRIIIDSKYTSRTDISDKFLNQGGDFNTLPGSVNKDDLTHKGLLSSGVWLNHRAVVTSILGADTLIKGISNLLDKMSAASGNYWSLTIDESEPESAGETHDYTVVDMHLKESSLKAVEVALNNLHVFNKYVRTDYRADMKGSDLIDCQVDLSLPKRLFAQIGTLGLVQPEDAQRANATGQSDSGQTTTPILSNPNEIFRKMFAITTISPKQGEKNPDVTLQYSGQQNPTQRVVCGNNIDSQLPLLAGGSGTSTTTVTDMELTEGATQRDPNQSMVSEAKEGTRYVRATEPTANNIKTSVEYRRKEYEKSCSTCPPLVTQPPTVAPPVFDTSTIDRGQPEPSVTSLEPLAPKFRAKVEELLKLMEADGHPLKINETLRSVALQNYYRNVKKVRPAALPGQSWHQYGLAIDIGPRNGGRTPQYLATLRKNTAKLGLTWGGNWPDDQLDQPHVQWAPLPGYSSTQKQRFVKMLLENKPGVLLEIWKELGVD